MRKQEIINYIENNQPTFYWDYRDELTSEQITLIAKGKAFEVVDEIYEWNIDNWGTKWNSDAQDWSVDEDFSTVTFWFDSAWSPPVELYKYITENTDFSVEAEYCEEGIGFVGRFVNGEEETYEFSDLEDLDDIPEELVENWNLRENMADWEEDDDE